MIINASIEIMHYLSTVNSRAIQYKTSENLSAFTINLVLLKCEADDLFSFMSEVAVCVVGSSVCALLMYVPGSW